MIGRTLFKVGKAYTTSGIMKEAFRRDYYIFIPTLGKIQFYRVKFPIMKFSI
ncbi:hypothetical protein MYP_829 [Sporocytophaga myxococcoides]|uniref:Uncharacterized protein n=1 Tax=Sporocytophaga myxococcoides TaxID=153721 RepID=A0A098LAX8_9BACT|nr:hypothetical protein MYP_829 [Sporocytophaga myxococcoides]